MRKLTKLEKFGLIAAIIVIGTYFYMGKIYDPQEKSLKKTIAKLNKVVKELNAIEDIKSAGAIKRTIESRKIKLEELKGKFGSAVRQTGDVAEVTILLDAISRLIESEKLMLVEIIPKGTGSDSEGIFDSWELFGITLTGEYFPILHFIEGLKNLQDPVIINNLFISRNSSGAGLNISMELMI
jgi:Tfp pilus assembly protein PilO